jgi:molybdopterin adenylyltransferase
MDRIPGGAAVLTVSDGVTHGTRDDTSGELAAKLLAEAGFEVGERAVVPDERDEIEDALRRLAAEHALVVTTGGTGFGPRDVTPEATKAVMTREAPGLAELMRAAGLEHTPMAALSRATAGVVGDALVLNLPGGPRGVRESLEAVLPVVPHAVELLAGATGAHPTAHAHVEPPPTTAVVATAVKVHGTPPCRVGSTMTIVPGGEVRGTLGCAEFDAAAVEAADELAAGAEPQTRTFHHELGDIEVYLEPRRPAARAVVVSATDVARALGAHLRGLGYRVELLEPRAARVTAEDRHAFDRVGDGEDPETGADDLVVCTDHDAPGLVATLAAALGSPARFIGVMGSRRHVGPYVEELRRMGFDDEQLGRIRSPVGLDLGGRSPEEIALSIVAGIVAATHGRDGGWLDR